MGIFVVGVPRLLGAPGTVCASECRRAVESVLKALIAVALRPSLVQEDSRLPPRFLGDTESSRETENILQELLLSALCRQEASDSAKLVDRCSFKGGKPESFLDGRTGSAHQEAISAATAEKDSLFFCMGRPKSPDRALPPIS